MTSRIKINVVSIGLGLLALSACSGSTSVGSGSGGPSTSYLSVEGGPSSTISAGPDDDGSLVWRESDCAIDHAASIKGLVEEADSIVAARLIDIEGGYRYNPVNDEGNYRYRDGVRLEKIHDEELLLTFEATQRLKGETEEQVKISMVGYETTGGQPGAERIAFKGECGLQISEDDEGELFGLALSRQAKGQDLYRYQDILRLNDKGVSKGIASSSLFRNTEGQKFSELVTLDDSNPVVLEYSAESGWCATAKDCRVYKIFADGSVVAFYKNHTSSVSASGSIDQADLSLWLDTVDNTDFEATRRRLEQAKSHGGLSDNGVAHFSLPNKSVDFSVPSSTFYDYKKGEYTEKFFADTQALIQLAEESTPLEPLED